EAGLLGRVTELRLLGEADAVRRALDAEIANLARVSHGIEEVRAECGLPAGKLNAELAPGLHAQAVVEDLLDVAPFELVDVPDLIGVHEARVAHHVAAVGQVD